MKTYTKLNRVFTAKLRPLGSASEINRSLRSQQALACRYKGQNYNELFRSKQDYRRLKTHYTDRPNSLRALCKA